LWQYVIVQKYVHPYSLEEWIKRPNKSIEGGSIIWKVLIHAFKGVGDGLAWRVGVGTKVRLGSNPWPGSGVNHILPPDLINHKCSMTLLPQSNL
jgi:hypothetical protein